MTKEDLKSFPDLKQFDFEYNQIVTVEKELFLYNRKLEYINLNDNKIKHIDPNVLDSLHFLKAALFLRNTYVNIAGENLQQIENLKKALKAFNKK